ncbi:MAG: ParA family protein [Tepidimonas sp.]|uniref:ParA family protein n=1 Tax=Tepidimonas sp. TaxID=2002775 RepID=UPI00259D82EF|nr:ParA family protein [Tepidimonas sp.]MDM7457335.1 ParA family protein [Tepidimonas sp.]
MPVLAIANPKGGVGKTTLATQIAGHWARCGYAVMLGDVDRQQSCARWLALRPTAVRPIAGWDASRSDVLKPPRGTTHVVLDTPAGLHGQRLREVLRRADRLLVPVQPGVFDMFATHDFLQLVRERRHEGLAVAVVGMRIDERTLAARHLQDFFEALDLPVAGFVREAQLYRHLAAQGLTLFDVRPHQVERELALWRSLLAWVDG